MQYSAVHSSVKNRPRLYASETHRNARRHAHTPRIGSATRTVRLGPQFSAVRAPALALPPAFYLHPACTDGRPATASTKRTVVRHRHPLRIRVSSACPAAAILLPMSATHRVSQRAKRSTPSRIPVRLNSPDTRNSRCMCRTFFVARCAGWLYSSTSVCYS